MNDNKGFSLIELLIIIALMGIVITFGLSQSQAIFSYNAQEAYKKVVSTITAGKVHVLSKSQVTSDAVAVKSGTTVSSEIASKGVYIEFYVDGNAIYSKTYVKGVPLEAKGVKIGGKGVVITYKVEGGALQTLTAGEGEGLMFSFDRSTGGFLPYSGTSYVDEIHVSGGRRDYKITLMPKTGKVVKAGRM